MQYERRNTERGRISVLKWENETFVEIWIARVLQSHSRCACRRHASYANSLRTNASRIGRRTVYIRGKEKNITPFATGEFLESTQLESQVLRQTAPALRGNNCVQRDCWRLSMMRNTWRHSAPLCPFSYWFFMMFQLCVYPSFNKIQVLPTKTFRNDTPRLERRLLKTRPSVSACQRYFIEWPR